MGASGRRKGGEGHGGVGEWGAGGVRGERRAIRLSLRPSHNQPALGELMIRNPGPPNHGHPSTAEPQMEGLADGGWSLEGTHAVPLLAHTHSTLRQVRGFSHHLCAGQSQLYLRPRPWNRDPGQLSNCLLDLSMDVTKYPNSTRSDQLGSTPLHRGLSRLPSSMRAITICPSRNLGELPKPPTPQCRPSALPLPTLAWTVAAVSPAWPLNSAGP